MSLEPEARVTTRDRLISALKWAPVGLVLFGGAWLRDPTVPDGLSGLAYLAGMLVPFLAVGLAIGWFTARAKR